MGAASISVLPQQRVNCVRWCCVLLLRRTAVRVGRSAWRSFAQRAKAQQELPLHFNSCPTPRTSDRGCATSEAALSSLYGGTNSPIYGVTLLGGRRDIRSNLSYLGDTHPAIVVASAPGTLRPLVVGRRGRCVLCVLVLRIQLLPRSRLALVRRELCWVLLYVFSHPREV